MTIESYRKQLEHLEAEAIEMADYMSDDDTQIEQQQTNDQSSFCDDFSACIIVDNLPIVGEEKYEKLCNVIRNMLSRIGTIIDLNMPLHNRQSCGFAFIEYDDPKKADAAVEKIDNFALDKRHTLRVNHFDYLRKVMTSPDTYVQPTKQEYQQK